MLVGHAGGRARVPPPARRSGRQAEGGLLGGDAGASTHLARSSALSGSLRRLRAANAAAAGWLAGLLGGVRERRSAGLRLPSFHLRSEFAYLRADTGNAHLWAGRGTHCLSGFCLPPERLAIAAELFSAPVGPP